MSAPIAFISAGAGVDALAQAGSPLSMLATGMPDQASGSGSAFGNVLQAQLAELDRSLKSAQAGAMRLAAGQADSLHHLMLEMEQARIAFQFALQVRNRLIEGWQDVQRMQL